MGNSWRCKLMRANEHVHVKVLNELWFCKSMAKAVIILMIVSIFTK